MSGNNCIYFCEGSCDEVFIKALKEKPELITPGKTKVLNVISTYIPRSVLMTVKPGTTVVFVFDTDVPITEKLRKNIEYIKTYCGKSKLVFLPQVQNLEDEIVRATDAERITDITQSRSLSNFKTAFCRISNPRAVLTKHQLDVMKLWTTEPPEVFAFLPQNSGSIKV